MPLRDNVALMRAYKREWVKKRRESFFKDKICIRCGSKDNLELDHIDPSTKISHSIWSWSEKRRVEEIAKCQVLCKKCHKDKCIEDGTIPYQYKHGTKSMYDRHKCKCDECRNWKKKKIRKDRENKKLKKLQKDLENGFPYNDGGSYHF